MVVRRLLMWQGVLSQSSVAGRGMGGLRRRLRC
jgi:hypothetical protein